METTEIELLPTEMVQVINNSKLVITEAQSIAVKFLPFMNKVNDLSQKIAVIEKVNPTEEDAKLARKYRLELVSNRGKNGIDTVHTELKAGLLIKAKVIDNFKNLVENTSLLSENEAEAIEKHQERKEKERQDNLANTRRDELTAIGVDTEYLPLGIMTDEQYARCVENGKLAFVAKQAAAEKAEVDRIEAERLAAESEKERLRLQAERIEAERLEAIRVKEELATKEAELAKERELAVAEQKRRDAELEKERAAAKLLADKLAKENAAKLAEQKRLADLQKAEADKLAKELQAKKDAELKAENERVAKEKAALNADDKEKVRQLHTALKTIVIPLFTTDQGKEIGNTMREALDILIKGLVQDSKKLM